ncbi:hypothetical protein [Comamonas koreensis]|uniref:Lipoprotein n=1 Tax=Comamonas koreensis TaxID=160825 RepID=A0AAW4XVL9_9BURK|nr:hypothetical protein [Comamonas koreensis]MCD2165564.1 hypothetical protein [Comamonas koreensis]
MKSFINATFLSSVFIIGSLTGCAVENRSTGSSGIGRTYMSDIKTLANGNFYVEAEAAPLAGRQGGALRVTTERATDFCSQQYKKMIVVHEEADSHLLVNGVSRLTFVCQ